MQKTYPGPIIYFVLSLSFLLGLLWINLVARADEPEKTAITTPSSGPHLQCITVNHIKTHHSPDDQTILFTMKDGKVWKNTLPAPCARLKFQDSFTFNVSNLKLCSSDTISVLRGSGSLCQLGQFSPYQAKKISDAKEK